MYLTTFSLEFSLNTVMEASRCPHRNNSNVFIILYLAPVSMSTLEVYRTELFLVLLSKFYNE